LPESLDSQALAVIEKRRCTTMRKPLALILTIFVGALAIGCEGDVKPKTPAVPKSDLGSPGGPKADGTKPDGTKAAPETTPPTKAAK
jgi:hypothetical protein